MLPTEPVPLLVFDLDGTILRINSFPRWTLYLLVGRIPGLGPRRRVKLSLATLLLVITRKLGRISHVELQRHLQVVAGPFRAGTTARFRDSLLRHLRPNLHTLLQMVQHREVAAILATAACAEYAEDLGRQLGFSHIAATRSNRSPGEPSNSGEEKRREVRRIRTAAGWSDQPMILFTDHIDDLPLIRDSSLVCWFGSTKMLRKAASLVEGVQFIDCRSINSVDLDAILRFPRNTATYTLLSPMTMS